MTDRAQLLARHRELVRGELPARARAAGWVVRAGDPPVRQLDAPSLVWRGGRPEPA